MACSWTKGHIESLWHRKSTVVYPPCDVLGLTQIPLTGRMPWIISVAQFRPEKNHMMQLDAFALSLRALGGHASQIRLLLVGGVRNNDDQVGQWSASRIYTSFIASCLETCRCIKNVCKKTWHCRSSGFPYKRQLRRTIPAPWKMFYWAARGTGSYINRIIT